MGSTIICYLASNAAYDNTGLECLTIMASAGQVCVQHDIYSGDLDVAPRIKITGRVVGIVHCTYAISVDPCDHMLFVVYKRVSVLHLRCTCWHALCLLSMHCI